MKRRKEFEDDGRTIADMSGLDGRSGSAKGNEKGNSYSEGRGTEGSRQREERPWENSSFSWKERFYYIGAALEAALLIALVFLAGIALVIWLITLYG